MYKKEHELVSAFVKEAYINIIKEKYESKSFDINLKNINDLVTECDYDVERYLIDKIREAFPEDNFLAEETLSDSKNCGRTWIIDPIDGTVNFSKDIHLFGIQLALVVDKAPVYSCIYLPRFDEMYHAITEQGAYLNGKPIYVSKEDDLFHSIITIGDFSHKNLEFSNKQINLMGKLYDKVRKFKMFGAACIDFTSLAAGKTEAHIMYTKNLWDLIPGYFLTIEAGGVSNYNPNNPTDFIIVSNKIETLEAILAEI